VSIPISGTYCDQQKWARWIPLTKGVTDDDWAEPIVNAYRNNCRKSIWSLEHVRLPKLADVFAGTKALFGNPLCYLRPRSLSHA
jgi:hypothetical protein